MSKTKFPHPSAPTIARTSPSSSGSRISTEAECSRTERGLSRSPPPLPLAPPSTAQGAYSGKEAKRQSPAKKPPGLGSAAPRGGPRKAGKLPVVAAVAADNRLSDGDAVREASLGSFPIKPRGGKGGRRGPGGQMVDPELEVASNDLGESAAAAAATAAEATRSGSTGGPRPVFCICRRPAIPGETTMLACTDCKESFHRSCVGVPSNAIHNVAAPYVCSACLKQHPRRRRAPGTILGVGSKIAPAAGAPKRSKKTPDVATVDPIAMAGPMPGKDSSTNSMALPTANQAALAAFMNLAGAMDEDDICPICEDECTCRGGEQTAGAGLGGGEHAGDGGAPMPLFSQISRHTADSSMDAVLAPTAATKRGGGVRAGKRPAATKAEGGVAKARAAKTKAAATKPRAKKGKNSEKSAISRLVGAMDSTAPAGKDSEEEEEDSDDEKEEESVFVSGRGGGSHWQVDDKPVARLPAVAASAAPAPRAKTTWHVQPGVTSSTKPVNLARAKAARPAKRSTGAGASVGWVREVDAAVIRGRGPRAAAGRRGVSPLHGSSDELINITDVTSDTSGGIPSETEFDLPSSAMLDDDDDFDDGGDSERIEEEEEAYLTHMRAGGLSSSSLSDLDDSRLAGIRGL
ncbi:hypothetical protein GGF42_005611, partial [Coemansia sp. RSA 2424]